MRIQPPFVLRRKQHARALAHRKASAFNDPCRRMAKYARALSRAHAATFQELRASQGLLNRAPRTHVKPHGFAARLPSHATKCASRASALKSFERPRAPAVARIVFNGGGDARVCVVVRANQN
eukprot:1666126-Pyramimonas_sp.AAC.1